MTILLELPKKTISIRQPWAWLICNFKGVFGDGPYPLSIPPKRIENRQRLKHIKGRHLIHAGARFDRAGYDYFITMLLAGPVTCEVITEFLGELPTPDQYDLGGIVGWADFKGAFVTDSDDMWYSPGQNGLLISKAGSLPFHPCKGKLSIFEVEYPREEQ